MKKEEIIDELKAQYPRDLRKQLIYRTAIHPHESNIFLCP